MIKNLHEVSMSITLIFLNGIAVELDNSINTNKKVLESIVNSYKNQRYIQKLVVVTISLLMF